MLEILKRIFAYLLSVLFAAAIPLQTRTAAPQAASDGFYLAAVTANRTLIEPEFVPAESGDTIGDALRKTAHVWEGLDGGYLYAIDGAQANYRMFADDGECGLHTPASSASAVLIGVTSIYAPALLSLVRRMGEYRAAANGVQNYPPAQNAYNAALDGLRNADAPTAQRLLDALNEAVAQYASILNGEKYRVAFSASAALSGTLTDAYGNVTAVGNSAADVPAGTYTFSVYAEENSRTEGTISVSGPMQVPVDLPVGAWFGEVRLLDADKNAFPAEQTAQSTSVRIPDHVGGTGVYLYAQIGAVPDINATRLRALYVGTDGADQSSVPRSWDSRNVSLTNLLSVGTAGRAFQLEASFSDGKGFTQIETHTVSVRRTPTLTALRVLSDGVNMLAGFERDGLNYTLPASSETVTIRAGADAAYTIAIDGEETAEREIENDSGTHTVSVTARGQTTVYSLRLQKRNGVTLTLRVPDGTTAVLQTEGGERLTPLKAQTYTVVPGVAYRYVATRNTVYHTSASVTAAGDTTVEVCAPDCADALEEIALYDRSNASTRKAYIPDAPFDAGRHSCGYVVSDTSSVLYAQATAAEGYDVTAVYRAQSDAQQKHTAVSNRVSGTGNASYLSGVLARGGVAQTITVRVSRTADGTEYYQDYTLRIARSLHLTALAIAVRDEAAQFTDAAGEIVAFDRDRTAYIVCVPQETQSVRLDSAFPVEDGYTLTVNGGTLTDGMLPLDISQAEETAEICVHHTDPDAKAGRYTVRFRKVSPVRLQIQTVPENACVFLVRLRDGQRVVPRDGGFDVLPGETYSCTVTAGGYQGEKIESYTAPQSDAVLTVALSKAPAGEPLPQFDAQWPSFRADRCNNGVLSAKTPIDPRETALYWATKIGADSAETCGCPIMAGGDLYTYAGSTLYKIDAASGAVLRCGQMDHAAGFCIHAPTYADGMLFVGLSDGTVQAFNADTLESLWIYKDAIGGQPNSPITYADGYIYTGFWQGETLDANYVCLSVTDEDPTLPDEEKLACWTYTHTGGFYGSGAYAAENAVVVATDDGKAGYTEGFAQIVSLHPRTGEILGRVTMPRPGDIRSGVMMDASTGMCCFTSKGGWFGTLRLLPNGAPDASSLRLLELQNGSGTPAMSTSTPTIYNGRAYVGVSGSDQFGLYAGHNITVIDLAHMEIAYTAATRGYPQTSGVLTTGYDTGDGTVYVYFIDNYTPGKLRVLRDRPGQTKPYPTERETYTLDGKTVSVETAPVLFTPYDAHAQYALCSPIADADGTLYFKNDSGYLFAVGSAPLRISVTSQPEKTVYTEGETFSADGMRVTATFANGTVRDVTDDIRFSAQPLTTDDTDFRLVYPFALYHDGDRGPGTRCTQPSAVLSLRILPRVLRGDVDGDGKITALDGDLVYAYHNAECTLTPEQLERADMNDDGRVNALDAAMIYADTARAVSAAA